MLGELPKGSPITEHLSLAQSDEQMSSDTVDMEISPLSGVCYLSYDYAQANNRDGISIAINISCTHFTLAIQGSHNFIQMDKMG